MHSSGLAAAVDQQFDHLIVLSLYEHPVLLILADVVS